MCYEVRAKARKIEVIMLSDKLRHIQRATLAVNRLVAGSNPARGATLNQGLSSTEAVTRLSLARRS
jgi:hypothetical protein